MILKFLDVTKNFRSSAFLSLTLLAAIIAGSGCKTATGPAMAAPGTFEPRQGDEIVVAGKFFHTGTPIVTWMDPGGYDAYRVERRFSPYDKSDWTTSHKEEKELNQPNRYNLRKGDLTPEEIERVRGGGWDLPLLQRTIDQFVLHYDVAGVSRTCFRTLHDVRDLSVQFMLDIDGTIYQTLDLKERAAHATIANGRSVGVEIANIGAYPTPTDPALKKWYGLDQNGHVRITLPKGLGNGGVRTPNFVGHPAKPTLVTGPVQGRELNQYNYTPQQYAALTKLIATLCTVFPKLKCDYPKDASGKLITHKLPDDDYYKYEGVMGHYHVQTNKIDPGPAMDWDLIINGARKIMAENGK